jgi:exodeoxyribonuclease VII small subunit
MATKTYRELQEALDNVLEELQSAELDIDKALALHKRGEKLLAELEEYLKNAKNQVEQLKK